MNDYELLPFDSGLLGFAVARITLAGEARAELETTLGQLRANGAGLAYWMVEAEDAAAARLAARLGGVLVDRKLTYCRELGGRTPPIAEAQGVVPYALPTPTPALVQLAFQAGEYSRFRLDGKIPAGAFESLYRTWIEKSVSRELARETLVVHEEDELAGFITLGEKQGDGDIGLVAVTEGHRGRGVGSRLVQAGLGWFSQQGYSRARVVTQGANTLACALYERNGFDVEEAQDVFHFWVK